MTWFSNRVALSTLTWMKEAGMKIAAFHTVTPERGEPGHRDVYHDVSDCPDGMRIKPANRRAGTGGRPKCEYCRDH